MQCRAGPWLFHVCRNRAIDELRRRFGAQQASEHVFDRPDARQSDPTKLAEDSDLLTFIQQLISTLPPIQQEVIELWSHGLKHDEIAEVVEKSPGAVRAILHRAIKQLKSHPHIRTWLRENTQRESPQLETNHPSHTRQH